MKITRSLILLLLVASPAAAELSSAITSPYLKVQVALAGDSTEGVAEAAHAIVDAAATLGNDAKDLAVAAGTLADAGDISGARAAFGALSAALIEYADSVGIGELRVAFCPMANESWVQEDGPIANPFFDAIMLDCGSLQIAPSRPQIASSCPNCPLHC